MFKKICTIMLLFFIGINWVFAEITAELELDKDLVNLNENFTINLKIKNDSNKNLQITEIPGINNFDIVSKANLYNSVNNNGDVVIESSFQFVLNPKKSGKYQIGPIVINDGENKITSNSVNIQINDILPKIENDEDLEKKDINTVKKGALSYKDFLYSPTLLLILVVFGISLYFLWKENTKKPEDIIEKIDNKLIIKEKLCLLKNEIENLNKNEFYSKINVIFREYFEYLGVHGAQQKTLKELEKYDLNKFVFKLFKKSYSKEFSNSVDKKITRKKIIDDFIDNLSE